MAELPTGTVTFLFTDLAGSTRLWEQHPDAMQRALRRHDEIIRDAIDANRGHVVKTTGDGFHAAFATAQDAAAAAVAAQLALTRETWTETDALSVRMALHTGEAQHRDGDYFGPALNRAARLMSVGHGGQVLVSAATQELLRDALPEHWSLVELGEHRLRDLGRPESIFQLAHPGLPQDFGPLRTMDAFPGNLPLQVGTFVGRDDDLDRVIEAMATSPVVTLTGVGGVGKTRLALQVAAEVLPRFRDGAWLCELATVRDPSGVVDAVAGVLRVSARPGAKLEESLVAYLRDLELLLVLDNCEHLLRPVAALVAKVEATCPRVRVLATSREGLNVRGEQILVVPSLGVPDEGVDLGVLRQCESVRLFADRARATKASFVVDAGNADAVAQVCRRLDGVPLAIELAAARIAAMNPAEIARRLDQRFRLLTGGERTAIERHQTLRAAIDWSYELLTAPEQRLLARLAVFSGGCTLDAAEAVCAGDPIDPDDVFDLLASLVARSLVVVDDTGPDTRYRLLETIRQYGEDRLRDLSEVDALRQRHAAHYADFAGLVQSHIYGPGIDWAARLAREHENLVAAMAHALSTQNAELAVSLFCRLPGPGSQVNEVVIFDCESLLALPGVNEQPGIAQVMAAAAFRAWGRGDLPRAEELCDATEAASRRSMAGPRPGLGLDASIFSSMVRGHIAQARGRTDEAVRCYLSSVEGARAAGIPALASIYLGTASQTLAWADPAAARQLAGEGLTLARATGMPYAIDYNLFGLAQALAPGEPEQARTLLHEALQLSRELGYESPNELVSAVFTAARLGEWSIALRAAGRALHYYSRTGGFGVIYLAAILNLVARGLAEDEPEPAAIVQGAVARLLGNLSPSVAVPVSDGRASGNEVARFVADVRRETSQLLSSRLDESIRRELRALGQKMDELEACTYARLRIDEQLGSAAEREHVVPEHSIGSSASAC